MDNTYLLLVLLLLGLVLASWYLAPVFWAQRILSAARRSGGLSSHSITVDGNQWHYLQGGKGPLLLLIHGFGGDADNWLMLQPYLRRHFTVLAPDLPGFGTSEAVADAAFDINTQTDRLEAFLATLNLQPDFIAGNSMGGWIAANLARRARTKHQALWLLNPLGTENCKTSEMLTAISVADQSPIEIEHASEFKRRVVNPMFVRPPPMPYPLHRLYADRAVRRSAQSRRQFAQVLQSAENLEIIVEQIRLPILLQWGKQDRAVDVSGADTLAKINPQIECFLQEGIGHLPMLEAPALSARAFISFCAKHELVQTNAPK